MVEGVPRHIRQTAQLQGWKRKHDFISTYNGRRSFYRVRKFAIAESNSMEQLMLKSPDMTRNWSTTTTRYSYDRIFVWYWLVMQKFHCQHNKAEEIHRMPRLLAKNEKFRQAEKAKISHPKISIFIENTARSRYDKNLPEILVSYNDGRRIKRVRNNEIIKLRN